MMWTPIALTELEELITNDLATCSEKARSYFERIRIAPAKWSQDPWGDEGGGFWVVAVDGSQALWYNDIEHGFNVSTFKSTGVIPADAYFCNQDTLEFALQRLGSHKAGGFGPPVPTSE